VAGDSRKLHNEELHNLYACTLHQILLGPSNQGGRYLRGMEHAWERNSDTILVLKREGKTLVGRPRRRWEDLKWNLGK
jgi:hypothetical protein